MTELYNDQQYFKVGRVDGDRRRFYTNRQLAMNYANDAAKYWPDKVRSVDVQFEPNHGFVPILYTTGALPEAQENGFEIHDALVTFRPTATPADWAGKKKATTSCATPGGTTVATRFTAGGSQRPSRGKTLQAWEIFDSIPTATRKEAIAAGVAQGLNPNMLGTQYSRWAKEHSSPKFRHLCVDAVGAIL